MEIYEPSEDSFLLGEVLEKNLPKIIKKNKEANLLEIGIGSGFLLEKALNLGIKKENILGVDINSEAVLFCKNKGFKCIKSNLFSKLKKNLKFDIIIFNPPYLPEDILEPKESKIITTGGKNGGELINIFLSEASNYLKNSGKIFLLISSLSKKINWNKLKKRKLAEKNLFFEKIFVYEIK